jgi:hypothetical protein
MSTIKDDTKRIVVTVELDIDLDGIEKLVSKFQGDMTNYLNYILNTDVEVRKILDTQEFGE